MKRTDGGLFDPATQRQAYFGAGNLPSRMPVCPPYTLIAVNDLMTNTTELDGALEAGLLVFLDSGIFNLTQRHKKAHPGMTMDDALTLAPEQIDGFEKLFTRYVELATAYRDRLWGCVELDQGGAANKRRTRARLEDAGIVPIPVYHPLNDGWEYFDELAGAYDRICVGNIVQASQALRTRILATIWERHREYPELWIHGLGYTPTTLLHAYGFDSVDSSTWLAPLRWLNAGKQVTADLEGVSDHQGEGRYMGGVRRARDKACALATWTVHSATCQWRAHRDELLELGVPPLPPRLDCEVAPCPSA